jgi:hypothetical protein
MAIENRLNIEIQYGWVGVQRLRQRMAGRALDEQRLHPVHNRHIPILT